MNNKTKLWLSVGILILAFAVIFIFFRANEDNWIKTEKGLYIKHGNPSFIPDYVQKQQDALSCASELYASESLKNISFSSQCLGICSFGEGYAVDIVHVPRTNEDNLPENQCSDYNSGIVKNFIELDKNGGLVRVVD